MYRDYAETIDNKFKKALDNLESVNSGSISWDYFDRYILPGLPHTDYIILLAYKYKFEKSYIVENNLLLAESETVYVWQNDWNEGQQDVYVLACTSVSDVKHNHLYLGGIQI